MSHFADRLAAAVRAKGNAVCVGLDPRWESLPASLRDRHGGATLATVAAAFEEFCGRVLDIVAPLVPVVKPQSAFFEACGPEGMAVLQRLLRKARDLGLLTILDGKRNDIASTAAAYADAAFAGTRLAGRTYPVWEADALTINPYLGRDAVEPFLESARRASRRACSCWCGPAIQAPGSSRICSFPAVRSRPDRCISTSAPPCRPGRGRTSAPVAWATSAPWSVRRTRPNWRCCGRFCRR